MIPTRADEWMLVFILVFFVLVYTTSVSLSMLRTSWDSAGGARIFFSLSVYCNKSHCFLMYFIASVHIVDVLPVI